MRIDVFLTVNRSVNFEGDKVEAVPNIVDNNLLIYKADKKGEKKLTANFKVWLYWVVVEQ